MKLFVYGSLRTGCYNHHHLEGAEFVDFATVKDHVMVDLGAYPAAIEMNGKQIVGEVFEVDTTILNNIDILEGYNKYDEEDSLYVRKKVKTDLGECFIYIWNDEIDWEGAMLEDWLEVA